MHLQGKRGGSFVTNSDPQSQITKSVTGFLRVGLHSNPVHSHTYTPWVKHCTETLYSTDPVLQVSNLRKGKNRMSKRALLPGSSLTLVSSERVAGAATGSLSSWCHLCGQKTWALQGGVGQAVPEEVLKPGCTYQCLPKSSTLHPRGRKSNLDLLLGIKCGTEIGASLQDYRANVVLWEF